jgi:hypothetical protein
VENEEVAVSHALDELSFVRFNEGQEDLLIVTDERGELHWREGLRLLRVALDVGEKDDEVLHVLALELERFAFRAEIDGGAGFFRESLLTIFPGRGPPETKDELQHSGTKLLRGAQEQLTKRLVDGGALIGQERNKGGKEARPKKTLQ